MRPIRLISALGLLAAAAPAFSQPVSNVPDTKGFYATLGVGASWPRNVAVSDSALNQILGTPVQGTLNTGGGFAGDVGIGYDFGAVRTELTYAYAHSDINSVSGSALGLTGTVGASASANTNSVLASAYYDIPTKSRWVPYLGGGIGYTNASIGTTTASVLGVNSSVPGGSKGLFGYQAKVGLSYLATESTDLYLEGIYQGAPGFTVDTANYGSLNSWGAKVGFRYRFGQAKSAPVAEAPAPAPAPQPEPAPAPAPQPAPQAPVRGLW